jgi:hypothetical protein
MVRCGIFQGLRRRGAVLGAVLVYALLLNALALALFETRALASALDPLTNAATCDPAGSGPNGVPDGHENRHQPDCMLCSAACPMGGMVQAVDGGGAILVQRPASPTLQAEAPSGDGIHPRSVYRSDSDAQAPPAIG